MVISRSFLELFDASVTSTAVTLPAVKENHLKIEFCRDEAIENVYEGKEPILPFSNSTVFEANIVKWRRMTPLQNDCKSVYEITFDITGSNYTYNPGDTIGIIPESDATDVKFILSHLDLESYADIPYLLTVDRSQKGAKLPPHVPVKSSLRYVFTYCLDLRSVVKKLFILALASHTKDENERKVLEYLCSKEGSTSYTTHILNKNFCILDLFAIFKTCHPPVDVLLANLPRLLPRPYSIVNSSMKNENVIKICFSVMEINGRKGLVTGFLENLILDTNDSLENCMQRLTIDQRTVPIYLRKNIAGFALPSKDTPLVLIGPGTGVAPYIGFLEERELMKQSNPEVSIGDSWLFFGCRNPRLDFIYEEELRGFVEKGILTKLSTAFSRDENSECKYIQDSIKQSGKELTEFINKGASIFVCGDLKTMATQIKELLTQCLVDHEGHSFEEALTYISDLQKEKRYFVDAWS